MQIRKLRFRICFLIFWLVANQVPCVCACDMAGVRIHFHSSLFQAFLAIQVWVGDRSQRWWEVSAGKLTSLDNESFGS